VFFRSINFQCESALLGFVGLFSFFFVTLFVSVYVVFRRSMYFLMGLFCSQEWRVSAGVRGIVAYCVFSGTDLWHLVQNGALLIGWLVVNSWLVFVATLFVVL